MRFSKQLLSVFVDFLFLTFLFFMIAASAIALRFLFYPKGETSEIIICTTEKLPLSFENTLSVNDTVYDPISKRKIGEIKNLKPIYDGERVKFIIEIDAKFKPKSDSLRTRSLWFRYYINSEGTEA